MKKFSGTHLTIDGIATGAVQLATLSVTGLPNFATRAWVKSVGDWFVLGPAVGTAVANVVVTAPDGRQWIRQLVPNYAWQMQATWSVDAGNVSGLASDENSGIDATHPLLTSDEFIRRTSRIVSTLATLTTAGLMPAMSAVKLGYLGDLIDSQTISGQTSFTPAAWNAGQYREIQIVSRTTGGMIPGFPARITFNGDVTNNYDTLTHFTQGSLAISPNSQFGAPAGQLALTGSASNVPDMLLTIRVFPLKLTSGHRPFTCEFHAEGTTTATFIMGTSRGFWLDTTHDMTYTTLTYGAPATGNVTVIGIPA